ncbi:MAG: twin-arginine translocation signal domain-containing protein, partial [Chloroflexi bacterium]|nr:twin-arginine translocation signal domain-containing protein [Chloroflexota bacterium]
MVRKKLSRRDFLTLSAGTAAASLLAACGAQPAAPPPAAEEKAEAPATEQKEEQAPAAASAGAALTFWNMPFVTQEVSPEYVKQWEEAVKTTLPNLTVDSFYGPGEYKPQRDKFLLQAKSATPDVIEGLLEDVAVYVKNELIDPLDERFNAWADKPQFVEATLAPL